jgi:hypothetical protein
MHDNSGVSSTVRSFVSARFFFDGVSSTSLFPFSSSLYYFIESCIALKVLAAISPLDAFLILNSFSLCFVAASVSFWI